MGSKMISYRYLQLKEYTNDKISITLSITFINDNYGEVKYFGDKGEINQIMK